MVDDDLVTSTSIFKGDAYSCDNKLVFDLLKPFILEGPSCPFVQTFDNKRDSCAAFKALKAQAVGQSAIATGKAKTYAMIATAVFTGMGKYSFDQYVGRHQQEHNELLFIKESAAETKKVTDSLLVSVTQSWRPQFRVAWVMS